MQRRAATLERKAFNVRASCDARTYPLLDFSQNEANWSSAGSAVTQRDRLWKGRVVLEALVDGRSLKAGDLLDLGDPDDDQRGVETLDARGIWDNMRRRHEHFGHHIGLCRPRRYVTLLVCKQVEARF